MLTFIRIMLVVLFCSFMTSCSLLSPVQVEPAFTYRIDAAPVVLTDKRSGRSILLVTPPEANAQYVTSEMAYTRYKYQISYFSKNSWIQSPSQMLHPLIVNALRKTNSFASVNGSPTLGNYDFLVSTHILGFEQDFTRNPSIFRLYMRVQIVRAATNRVIASKDILIERPAYQNTPYSGVIAANNATAAALWAIASFCKSVIH